ncbi:hypothetical protein D1224_06220 [Henriciella barbarensis]|uniref:TonB C-terminal domain-containing protein n=1 Tax=Henriciella barbarensis TaxID=86342 RepID=A0A399QXJ4_9PROT|nr:energy transducer TonB [Henriciella barbarensis]RIJ23846.1 hypothetical protein D1224_06220 [Henriciella barbarensis]
MLRTIVISAIVTTGALSASGQAGDINDVISAYNEAASTGSAAERSAAARALGVAAMENPDHQDAGLLAYEAGQSLCVYDGCEGASQLAAFATSAEVPANAVPPAHIEILRTYADWKSQPNGQTRSALDGALEAGVDTGVSLLTLTAYQARYLYEFEKSDYREAEINARLASAHFAPFKDMIGKNWSDAAIAGIIAGFSRNPDTQDVVEMAEHRVALAKLSSETSDTPDWLDRHRHLAHAWQLAMYAYYESGGGRRQTGSRLQGPDPDQLKTVIRDSERRMRDYPKIRTRIVSAEEYEADESKLPFCSGELDMTPQLRYPMRASQRGMYGAVLARLKINDLKVSDVEILAAVPHSTFEERAKNTIMKWRWNVSSGTPGETCRTNHDNIFIPLIFAMES